VFFRKEEIRDFWSVRSGQLFPLRSKREMSMSVQLTCSLILTWPGSGAGTRVGDHRVAISLAVQVDASAAIAVGASSGGRPHAPATTCETGVPSLAACRPVSELKCRPGRGAAQVLDAPKKLLCWKGELLCVDAELHRCRSR